MRLIFMGTPESAVPTLARCVDDGHEVVAVWTQPDRPSGRGNKLKAPPIKEFALAHGLTAHQPERIRTDESFSLFSSYDADAAIVVAYGRILPAAYLHSPRRGCINVHFSLLPKYRGAAPVNWAIIGGEEVTGVSTMQIDEGLDTGPVFLQRQIAIREQESAPELLRRLSLTGADLLSETLARLDEIEPVPQDDSKSTPAPVLKRENGLIDWTRNATEIARRVRGLQPWPNAFTFLEGKRLVIWRAENCSFGSGTKDWIQAGEVVYLDADSFVVACGERSSLRIHEVQLEGKQRMSARDFVNGKHMTHGQRLG
jgi:methionyl-tRNA formyltransferase